MVVHDESAKRQEIVESMEQAFLQDLARAGANVPPRATVTTALLRGLLWEKREDELLTRGHTTIETQVVKSSRRSALLQLVSQVWKVPKPDYDKVDAMIASWAHGNGEAINNSHIKSSDSIALSSLASLMNHNSIHHSNNGASHGHSTHGAHAGAHSNHFSSRSTRKSSVPSSLGSSAEYDAYEALSSLSSFSDVMAVDGPSNGSMSHNTNNGAASSPSSASSSSSTANSASTLGSLARDGIGEQKEPIDSVTAVVFRSSPQLSSLKFNRSRGSLQSHSGAGELAQTSQGQSSGFQFPALVTSSNRFSKRQAQSQAASQTQQVPGSPSSVMTMSEPRFFERSSNRGSGGYSSPRSLASSPSSTTSTNDSIVAVHGSGTNGTTTPTSRSKSYALPVDLKSLMNHRNTNNNNGDATIGSPSSVSSSVSSSMCSDDSAPPPADSIHMISRNSSGARSFPSALKFSSPKVQPAVSPPPATAITNGVSFNTPHIPQMQQDSSPINHTTASLHQINPFGAVQQPMDPRLLSAALTPPPDHVPVWVPRTNPPVPLVLCPVRGPNGDWFYSYQPISYADMSLLVAAQHQAQAQAQASAAHLHSPSPFQPSLVSIQPQ